MIYFFVAKEKALKHLGRYFRRWGCASLRKRLKVVDYRSLLDEPAPLLEAGSLCIITGLDDVAIWDERDRRRFNDLHSRIVDRCGADRVLNDPSQSLKRFDLLRRLHREGINDFNVYRIDETEKPRRYPVFVRWEFFTQNTPPPLLDNQRALSEHCQEIKERRSEYIALEFLDTADRNGIYRKYSAFVLDGEIVPRHLLYDRNWLVKKASIVTSETIEEELDYLLRNPHKEFLSHCARLANIRYGRIDYGFWNGRPQIWEINIAPRFGGLTPPGDPRQGVHEHFAKAFNRALLDLESGKRR